jgi:hypothetical protein
LPVFYRIGPLTNQPPHAKTIGPRRNGKHIMVGKHRIVRFLACLAFAPAFLGCAATQKHESTGEYVDDSVLTTKVKAAILDEATLKTLQINVKTFKGVVQLSGFVDTAEYVAKAGEVAARVQGVKEVRNDLVAK